MLGRFAGSALAICAAISNADAQVTTAFGIWTFPAGTGNNARLVSFPINNPTNFTVIGTTSLSLSGNFPDGLDFNGSGGLFATGGANTNFLYSVNPSNGATTLIGGSGLLAGTNLVDLSWDPFRNQMLALGSGMTPALYQINTSNGVATLLGQITGMSGDVCRSLAVRPSNGEVFVHGIANDRWYRVDYSTLVATPLAPLPFNSDFEEGASFDPVSGVLYHAAVNGTTSGQLWTIDPATGNAALVGLLGPNPQPNGVSDIAFMPIPEPTSCSLVGLVAIGWAFARFRKRMSHTITALLR